MHNPNIFSIRFPKLDSLLPEVTHFPRRNENVTMMHCEQIQWRVFMCHQGSHIETMKRQRSCWFVKSMLWGTELFFCVNTQNSIERARKRNDHVSFRILSRYAPRDKQIRGSLKSRKTFLLSFFCLFLCLFVCFFAAGLRPQFFTRHQFETDLPSLHEGNLYFLVTFFTCISL